MTFSDDTVVVVTTGVAFQDKCNVSSDSGCDYDDYCYDGHDDENPDYFEFDDPGGFDNYPMCMVLLSRMIMSCIMISMGWMMGDCGLYCVLHISGETGGMSYWAGVEKDDDYEGNGVLPRTGSVEPVDSVVRTSGPVDPVNGDTPCWTSDGKSDNNEGNIILNPMSQSTVLFILPV